MFHPPNPGPNGPEIPTKRRFWRRGERAARRTRNGRLVPAYVPESGITEVGGLQPDRRKSNLTWMQHFSWKNAAAVLFVDVASPAEFSVYLELERKKFKKWDFRTTSTDL